jgi:hypothetical protein
MSEEAIINNVKTIVDRSVMTTPGKDSGIKSHKSLLPGSDMDIIRPEATKEGASKIYNLILKAMEKREVDSLDDLYNLLNPSATNDIEKILKAYKELGFDIEAEIFNFLYNKLKEKWEGGTSEINSNHEETTNEACCKECNNYFDIPYWWDKPYSPYYCKECYNDIRRKKQQRISNILKIIKCTQLYFDLVKHNSISTIVKHKEHKC